jgi:hypothetical protein
MSARRAWFSAVEYRPNPADPENGVIGLGFLIEFTTDKYWVVSAIMRAGIQEGQLASLDDLAKQLLEHRSDVIAKEINRVLPLAREPGEALALLSASNPWSLHVSEPREIEATAGAADASVETIQEEYVYAIYRTRWLPAVQAREAAQGGAGRQPPTRVIAQRPELNAAAAARTPADVPPPWLLPSTAVIRPLVESNRA